MSIPQTGARLSLAQSQSHAVIQTQAQTLSPMLQHAVRLLQLSSNDFSQEIADAVADNPFLELDEECSWAASRSWSSPSGPGNFMDGAADDTAGTLAVIPASMSLHEHLQTQLNSKRLGVRMRLLAGVIASALDDDAYLRDDLESLASVEGLEPPATMDELQAALREVQSLDPIGTGARNLSECLCLQLPSIESGHTRTIAQAIVSSHLELLAKGDLRRLAEKVHVPMADLQTACNAIRRLDPRPGHQFGTRLAHYVIPDVVARKQPHGGNRWIVELNDAVVPKLKLNALYTDLLYKARTIRETCDTSGPNSTDVDVNALDRLQMHITQARWTVRNVAQRFATIRDVAGVIVDRQRLFMEHGPLGMKPMSLRDVAREIGIHESTVCRVTNNKFISTPYGTFELTHFFSRGMAMADGNECSPQAVKELVQKCITEENTSKPLSDAAIAKLIQSQGVTVARRTVTKYRQLMRIAPVTQRGPNGVSMSSRLGLA